MGLQLDANDLDELFEKGPRKDEQTEKESSARKRAEAVEVDQSYSFQRPKRREPKLRVETVDFFLWSQNETRVFMPRQIESDQSDSFEREPQDRNTGELRMTKREMEQFYPRGAKGLEKDPREVVPELTEVLIKGLEKFDPFRQIFRRMRKAKETQRKLTQEILGHMQRRRRAGAEAPEPVENFTQTDSEMEFCDVIFKKIHQIYRQQKKVQLYKGHGNLQSGEGRRRPPKYSDLMAKDVDRGSFDFLRLFYREWAVSTKEKRTRDPASVDCCCAGNHFLADVLADSPFLGVYDVVDLLSLLGLHDCPRDQFSLSVEPEQESHVFKENDAESENSFSDSDSAKSGEGYAGLLGRLPKPSPKNQKVKVELLVEGVLRSRFQNHVFRAKENRVPVSRSFDSASVLGGLRKYLRIWEPVYLADPVGAGPSSPEFPIPRITLRMRDSYQRKRPCFVLAKHLRKRNWRVLGSEEKSVFVNDWLAPCTSLQDDRELTIKSRRGPVRTSKGFLERVLMHFQESFKSFLRLRFYLTRRLVRFVERHFDFVNFLLLERNTFKELLVCETQSGFSLHWRQFERFCCYREACIQCLDSVRSASARVRVEPLPADLARLVSDEFRPSFLELAGPLQLGRDEFVGLSVQEHRRFFQFICKMVELLSENNITEFFV